VKLRRCKQNFKRFSVHGAIQNTWDMRKSAEEKPTQELVISALAVILNKGSERYTCFNSL
jgi:hypothetical protein